MRSALLTGATGFIGGALAVRLREQGVLVYALVRPGRATSALDAIGVETVEGDLCSPPPILRELLRRVDTVWHAAARISPPYLPMEEFRALNRDGTARLVEACLGKSIRFVHVSTVAVVGSIPPGVRAAEDHPCRPLGRYGQSKLEAEIVIGEAARAGLAAVIARPMWTYGPQSRAMRRLLDWIASGRFFLLGRAANTLQPIWIDDLVDGLVKCAAVPGIEGRVYTFAGPETLETAALCQEAAVAMGIKLPDLRLPLSAARAAAFVMEKTLVPIGIRPPIDSNKIEFFEVNHSYSLERAKADLGWVPAVRWSEGVRRLTEAR